MTEGKMRTAAALGSNIGDRLENLRAARKAIFDLANVNPTILSSAVYETEPFGCEPGAGKFLNAVVEFEYEGDPARLLEQLINDERLQLPQPILHLRTFVLRPLADIRPDLVLFLEKKTVSDLLADFK